MQTVTSSLNSVNSSLSAVPDLTSYIASLTPAVTAYAALGPTVITDMQTQITSINSTITSVISSLPYMTLAPMRYNLPLLNACKLHRSLEPGWISGHASAVIGPVALGFTSPRPIR